MGYGWLLVPEYGVISLGVVQYCETAGLVVFRYVMYGAGMPGYGGLCTVEVCLGVLWYGMIWWGLRLVVCRYAEVFFGTV